MVRPSISHNTRSTRSLQSYITSYHAFLAESTSEPLDNALRTGCIPFNRLVTFGGGSFYYVYWIPILVFEAILCGLAVYKGYERWSESSADGTRVHTLEYLIKDSILYFFA